MLSQIIGLAVALFLARVAWACRGFLLVALLACLGIAVVGVLVTMPLWLGTGFFLAVSAMVGG